MERVFINKKFTQCKILHTLKIDVFEIPDKEILQNCFQNMNCFSWTKLISVLIHLRYWYYTSPHLELHCLPHHLCQVLPYPTETPLQHNTYYDLHRFPYFVVFHWTTHYHKYLDILKHVSSQANQIYYQFIYIQIIISYGSNTVPMKRLSL